MTEERVLMTGNEAAGEAAIRAGCRFYYGYPITPQNELTAYMAEHVPEAGGTFIQAESELAAISMVFGTSATGRRVMTSSSSPGISLKQEGISYMAGAELPAVIVNVMRGGAGLGSIFPAQGDYFQATRGGGHGDYRTIVLGPHTVQEIADLMILAFDLADVYRIPVLVLSDGQLGQMMEPLVFHDPPPRQLPPKDWALTGAKGRPRRIVASFRLREADLKALAKKLHDKYNEIEADEVRFEEIDADDAEVILVAYGTAARMCREVMRQAPPDLPRVGLIRPITLWPFPTAVIRRRAEEGKRFVAVEMSSGQMVDDVGLAVEGRSRVGLCGVFGCGTPRTNEIIDAVRAVVEAKGG